MKLVETNSQNETVVIIIPHFRRPRLAISKPEPEQKNEKYIIYDKTCISLSIVMLYDFHVKRAQVACFHSLLIVSFPGRSGLLSISDHFKVQK